MCRPGLLLALVLTVPAVASAQPYLEIGASVGQGCIMSEASCNNEAKPRGVQAGWWATEKTAVRFRSVEIPRPDLLVEVNDTASHLTDRRRMYWLGEATWHFGAPEAVRLYAGLSAGVQQERGTRTCLRGECPTVIEIPKVSIGGVAGISVHPSPRFIAMVQASTHDFPGEHVGTFTVGLHLVYRHPVRPKSAR